MYSISNTETPEKQELLDTLTAGSPNTFNTPLVGMKEVSEEEFANTIFFTYTPEAIHFMQVIDGNGRNIEWKNDPICYAMSMHFYLMFDGTAYGMYSEPYTDPDAPLGKRTKYRIRYFMAGCSHDYKTLTVKETKAKGIDHYGMCYHVSECTKCGQIYAVDSSD